MKADMLPVANTQLGPGSLAAILGGVFEGGEDTIWIHPDPNYTDDIKFDINDPANKNWQLHKDLLRRDCRAFHQPERTGRRTDRLSLPVADCRLCPVSALAPEQVRKPSVGCFR